MVLDLARAKIPEAGAGQSGLGRPLLVAMGQGPGLGDWRMAPQRGKSAASLWAGQGRPRGHRPRRGAWKGPGQDEGRSKVDRLGLLGAE
jgi:hypothetical protein